MLKRIHTYDLDGVLVDTAHRYRNLPNGSIDLDYWLKMRTQENIARDKLLPLAKQYRVDLANPETYVIVCTARERHALDVAFIRDVLGMPDKLIMRKPGDTTADAKLKRAQLARLFNLRQFQNLTRRFWDDNPRNLESCRDLFNSVFHIPSHITETTI